MRTNDLASLVTRSEAAGDLRLRATWLERFSAVSARLAQAQWRDTLRLAAYARLSTHDARELLSSTKWVADVFTSCLAEGRSFTGDELAELRRIGCQRARQGIDLAAVKERFRRGVVESSTEFSRLAFASSGPRVGQLVTALIIGEVMPLATAAEDALTAGYVSNGEPADSGQSATRTFGLTRQELRVLRLLPGQTNREIAGRLATSPETVKSHVASVLSKLGAHDRAHAVAIGMSEGLIPGRSNPTHLSRRA